MEARYLKSLVFEEEAMVTLRFAAVKRTSFVHEYAVWRQGLCFTCRTVLVAVDQASGARVPVPPSNPCGDAGGRREGRGGVTSSAPSAMWATGCRLRSTG